MTSTFDAVIEKRLPKLQETIKPGDGDLYHMVTALEKKKDIFERAFVVVKQESEQEEADKPNPQTIASSERLDLIYVRDADKLIEHLTKALPMDLEAFFEFF